ncbi:MAG: N-acetylglucosamine-6-phosphate deacetylase [Chloroflexota bacterium]
MSEVKAIINGAVAAPDGVVESGVVLLDGGAIRAVGVASGVDVPPGATVLDASEALVVPGFIDGHTHGGNGFDYMSAGEAEIATILGWLPQSGVTGVLATIASASLEQQLDLLRRLRAVQRQRPSGAAILGVHLEGPYIHPEKRGAQPASAVRAPNLAEVETILEEAGDLVRLVTLAPELDGALELIRFLADRGVVVSAGHTKATYEQMQAAVEAGVSRVAHVFNAMSPLHHRHPGVPGFVLTEPRVYAELILDGYHVDPVVARLLLRAKGVERVTLITDATQAAGLGDGAYVRPGGREIVVRDGAARLRAERPEEQSEQPLAGSVLTMDRAVGNATRWLDLSLPQAASMAGAVAAESLGLARQKGALAPGRDADIVLLEAKGRVRMTLVAGEVVYEA